MKEQVNWRSKKMNKIEELKNKISEMSLELQRLQLRDTQRCVLKEILESDDVDAIDAVWLDSNYSDYTLYLGGAPEIIKKKIIDVLKEWYTIVIDELDEGEWL